MSGSYSMKGTAQADAGGRVKKGSRVTNGNGPPPLSYPADPPDDENMNEIIDENIELTVLMPDGVTAYLQSVESHIPMMDLLVNLAATYKLSPTSHSLVVQTGDRWRQIDFKANKTIGLLADENQKVSVQIVKKQAEQKVRPKSTAQPFEMTYRFTVNLPQNQKKVLRISPKLLLGEVRQIVCQDKGYDPTRYVFLLPGKPNDVLDDTVTVGDLKSSEINFVSVTMLDAAAAKSLPDLAFAASQAGGESKTNQTKDMGPMPAESQKKAKSRFLSFLGKKEKKLKIQQPESSIEEPSSLNRPKKSESFNVRPKTVYTDSGSELDHFNIRNTTSDLRSHMDSRSIDFRKSTGASLIPLNENVALSSNRTGNKQPMKEAAPKKSGKKRAAPPPPQIKPQTVQVEIEDKPKSSQNSDISDNKPQDIVDNIPERVPVKRFHSRNSSDSSGYHELTLSGADSPDGARGDNLQTTLDTTSINSAEHFNGDSGIRDMSPVRSRGHKGNKKPSSRDSSLDIDKPTGKKKKRAPLPPPDVSAQTPIITNTTTVQEAGPSVTTHMVEDSPRSKGGDTDDELEALKAMEEVTMKFNIEDSEDDMDEDSGMRMVEDASVYSEDLDADLLSHRQRPPATFIAPPPPTEPPPADSEPVDINRLGQVITSDIGVGDDTTASPRSDKDSVKSSPIHMGSGPDSRRSSNSSVNTIEDLSLAFKQTIAMGEEALGLDSDLSDNDNVQDELQKEMGEFKDKIGQLAADEPEALNESNNSESSFIVHETETDQINSDRSSEVRGMINTTEGNRESSEITYEFTIDAVPAEFQNNEVHNDEEDENLDYEEYYEEEIVEILPADPQVFNADSPRRIPDLDSPKEHKSMSLVMPDSFRDEPVDNSTPKEVKKETKIDKVEVPAEKEEFVISLDELSNVDFSVAKPKKDGDVKPREIPPQVSYRIEFRNSRDYEDLDIQSSQSVSNVENVPVFRDSSDRDQVKSKCSELSFAPDSESEVEHVMEEKSISMINLPAERTPVKSSSPEMANDINEDHQTFASSTKLVLNSSTSSSQGSEMSPRKEDGLETQNLLQAQYQQLQQQFAMWQGQLVQNQQLLATNQNVPAGDDQSNLQLNQLQLQIQMQQQMLMQLQQNMQALTLQNSLAAVQQQPSLQNNLAAMQQPTMVVPTMAVPNNPILVNQPVIVPATTIQTQNIPPVQTQRPASPMTSTNEMRDEIPNAPPPPMLDDQPKQKKKTKQRRIKERTLEPREQLMLDIRNFGKGHLNKVPVKATHWHK